VTHLGPRISALVDGELGHDARDRALAHVAHCRTCRDTLESERAVKDLLAAAVPPAPSDRVLASLQALALPGNPVPPRARTMPQGPVVPVLPPPGQAPRGARTDSRAPAGSGPGAAATTRRTTRRARYAAVGALSVAGLVLGTAFAAGAPRQSPSPVVPPAAELTVEHNATTSGFSLGDPGLGVASGLGSAGDVTFPTVSRR
jgi:hypothetical protein